MQKRKHLSPRSAVCACTFLATSLCCLLSLAQPIGTLTGSITADYSSSTDPNTNITTYSFINASENLNLNVPTIPVSATSSGYWSDPFIWNGAPILLLNDGVTIAGVFSDVVGAFLSIPSTANTLINSGPTEQSPSIPGLNLSSNFLGINASFSVGANLTYDVTIPTGINVTMDQPTVAIHSLYLESGGMLSGNGNFIVRTSLLNQGTLQNLDGTIQGDFENNSYADITGSLAVQGTFTNLGSLYIESMGSLNLSTDSSNSGKIDLLGGSLNAPDTFINNGVFNWYGGTLPNTFRNSGQMAISNSGNQTINGAATVTNSGTILQSTGASLTMGGTTNTYNGDRYPSVLNNLSGATYDIQGDGGISDPANGSYTAPNASFNNAGLFEKTGGTGTTAISEVVFNNTGIIEVDSGTLSVQGSGSSTNGNFVVHADSVIRIASSYTLAGINTLTGDGTLEIPSGSLNADGTQGGQLNAAIGSTVLLDGGTLNDNIIFSGSGNFRWTAGATYSFTNTSPNFVITGHGNQTINGAATVTNSGTILQSTGASLTMGGTTNTYNGDRYPSVLNNLSGATYDIQGDGGISDPANGSYTAPNASFNNAGLFEKTGGTGTTAISEVVFNNTGIIEVDSGTLHFEGGLSNTGLINISCGTLISDNGIGGDSILAQLQSGYDHGAWKNTTGITSTLAASKPSTGVGYSISDNSVILMFTWLGDANLDGIITPDDYALLDRGFAKNLTGWQNGDFNYDGVINSADYLLLDTTYLSLNPSAAPALFAQREAQFGQAYVQSLLTSLPEPSLLAACGLALLPRRRRHANPNGKSTRLSTPPSVTR